MVSTSLANDVRAVIDWNVACPVALLRAARMAGDMVVWLVGYVAVYGPVTYAESKNKT